MSTMSAELPPRGLGKLLWELKTAWADATGKNVSVSGLLLERLELIQFLALAAREGDARVRELVAQILALEPDVASGVEAETAVARPGSPTVSPPARRAPVATLHSAARAQIEQPSKREPVVATRPTRGTLETVQSAAALVAAVLVSLAAARYLTNGSAPLSTVPLETASTSRGALLPAVPERFSSPPPASPSQPTAPTDPGAALLAATDVETVLRIHGSNTVGETLSPELVRRYLQKLGATAVVVRPGQSPEESEVRASIPGRARPVAVEMHAHGSTTAFADLADGRADIGQSSRRIKTEERDRMLESRGDLMTPAAEHVIALDGLAIIVSPQNPVRSLSIRQVADLFSGKIRDWSQVGGSPGPVHLLARDEKSGTWDTFKTLVLAPSSATLESTTRRFESSSGLSDEVAHDPAAIGFIGLPYVRQARALAISAEDGGFAIVPTAFTVSTEDYPLSRRLYFYAPPSVRSRWIDDLVAFALSQVGQQTAQDFGFVSQNPRTETLVVDASAPQAYRSLTADAQRLSLNFRFESGSETLDSKAQRDLDRVVGYLEAQRGHEIRLFGFTDNQGDDKTNAQLASRRAQQIERELLARGIQAGVVKGFGEAMPVASNSSDAGRERNRRVELWLR